MSERPVYLTEVQNQSPFLNDSQFSALTCLLQWRQTQWYDTIFDVYDDNNDTLEYTSEELNRYFYSSEQQTTMDEEETIADDVAMFIDNEIQVNRTLRRLLCQLFYLHSSLDNYERSSRRERDCRFVATVQPVINR